MEEKQIRRRFLTAAVFAVVAAALLFGGVATYAWFTSNQRVNTSRIETRTGDENVQLQVSSTGGADFRGGDEAAIAQVNATDAEYLMPVSTADLKTFFVPVAYNDDGQPSDYAVLEKEENYYHGRVYLRATGTDAVAGRRMALYLDQSAAAGGVLARKDEDGSYLLNAARLGLALQGGDSVIFYLSDVTNAAADRERNTVLDGVCCRRRASSSPAAPAQSPRWPTRPSPSRSAPWAITARWAPRWATLS